MISAPYKTKIFIQKWSFTLIRRAPLVLLGIAIGASVAIVGQVGKTFASKYSIEAGYFDEVHEFHPFGCERTRAGGDAYSTGVQRFVLTTGPSIEVLAKHQSLHYQYNETASPEWHKETIFIDYRKNHEVCVKHMWDVRGDDPLTCFDLYELGER